MTEICKAVHAGVDRMTDRQVTNLKEFLATFPSPLAVTCRNAPESEEPLTEEEARLVAEAEEWIRQNGGRGIPNEEIDREFGALVLA